MSANEISFLLLLTSRVLKAATELAAFQDMLAKARAEGRELNEEEWKILLDKDAVEDQRLADAVKS